MLCNKHQEKNKLKYSCSNCFFWSNPSRPIIIPNSTQTKADQKQTGEKGKLQDVHFPRTNSLCQYSTEKLQIGIRSYDECQLATDNVSRQIYFLTTTETTLTDAANTYACNDCKTLRDGWCFKQQTAVLVTSLNFTAQVFSNMSIERRGFPKPSKLISHIAMKTVIFYLKILLRCAAALPYFSFPWACWT